VADDGERIVRFLEHEAQALPPGASSKFSRKEPPPYPLRFLAGDAKVGAKGGSGASASTGTVGGAGAAADAKSDAVASTSGAGNAKSDGSASASDSKAHCTNAGLAVDWDHFVYVSDRTQHCVRVYDGNKGVYVGRWGKEGDKLGDLRAPRALAVTGTHLFICDSKGVQVCTRSSRFIPQRWRWLMALWFRFGLQVWQCGTGKPLAQFAVAGGAECIAVTGVGDGCLAFVSNMWHEVRRAAVALTRV
jgi:hypothetical protein